MIYIIDTQENGTGGFSYSKMKDYASINETKTPVNQEQKRATEDSTPHTGTTDKKPSQYEKLSDD